MRLKKLKILLNYLLKCRLQSLMMAYMMVNNWWDTEDQHRLECYQDVYSDMGDVDWNAESFEDRLSNASCPACGHKGLSIHQDATWNRIKCDNCGIEPFEAEESKKLPPVEKAIDTGIASGATMEGLETLMAAEWADEHPCEHCGSTDIDYGNNWKCHDCGRYAAEEQRFMRDCEDCGGDRVWCGGCGNCMGCGECYCANAEEEPSVYYWGKNRNAKSPTFISIRFRPIT